MQKFEFNNLKEVLEEYINKRDVGIYVIDIESNQGFGINEDKIYYSASTGKLPAVVYTEKKLSENIINNKIEYKYYDSINDIDGAMIRGGTGILQNQIKEGDFVSIKTLLETTCSNSDNLGSNMLGYYVCDKYEGEFLEYISNLIGREIKVFAKEFSAKEVAILMKKIYEYNGDAINYLENTEWDSVKIPKYLPVKVAHKIGINEPYNHDVAVVYTRSPYVISIMTNGENDEFISEVSKKVYKELVK